MLVIDYAPCVLDALRAAGELNQGDLCEAVWGSSGRGNSTLTNSLFPLCVRRGWVSMSKRGRSHVFALTPAGLAKLPPVGADCHATWDFERHDFKG